MYEFEIKLPVDSEREMEEKLAKLGFEPVRRIREEDWYFDNDAAEIRQGGKALRVRRITDLSSGAVETKVTFKGKQLDTVSKSRQEFETDVANGDTMMQIFKGLGFHPVSPSVSKVRQEYVCGDLNACLDFIEGLGYFLELEIVAAQESQKDEAAARFGEVLGQLGHTMEDTIRTSYLGLLQGWEDKA